MCLYLTQKSENMIPTFLKWAGGKRKILDKIDPFIPNEINDYYEPFLGGGSVFFYIKQKYNPKNCVISDINKDLINTFIDVRDNPQHVIKHLKKFKENNSEEHYYYIRSLFNKGKISGTKRSAAFIYLNKTCYNGLYRVNSKNEFNVPYGKYKNPEVFNEETILYASELLQGTTIKCQDYEELKETVEKGDFIYLDPCYDPLKKTSFAHYTPKKFSSEDNERLAKFVAEMNRRGAKILFSNNITKNIKKYYKEGEGFSREIIKSFRSVGSRKNYRGFFDEYLIRNFSN